MQRNSLQGASFRASYGATRATINEADDDKKMQELDLDGMHSDSRKRVERMQDYGTSSVPPPRDKSQQQGSSGGAGGGLGTGAGKKGPAAEALVINMGGQKNHPVAVVVDDRRYRPKKLKAGETVNYDMHKQANYRAEDGLYNVSSKKASLRHAPAKDDDMRGGDPNSEFMAEEKEAWIALANTKLFVIRDGKVYLGGDPAAGGQFSKVVTEDGPSVNVYAKVG